MFNICEVKISLRLMVTIGILPRRMKSENHDKTTLNWKGTDLLRSLCGNTSSPPKEIPRHPKNTERIVPFADYCCYRPTGANT